MPSLLSSIEFDATLLQKYNQPLPRYTSYPPATELKDSFNPLDWHTALAISNYKKTPLSLYCHIPFCETACYFCGCNTIITPRKSLADPYLDALLRSIHQTASQLDSNRIVHQLHWGGGTPNYLSLHQVEQLWSSLQTQFNFDPAAELSIEVNPRFLDKAYLFGLRNLGFNRISFGIQDFNPQVQQAVNRIQPEAMLFEGMDWMRQANFDSINVDLIYGLPYQTLETFQQTIQKTIQLNPDRIAVFNFAYVPWMKPVQKRIAVEALPQPDEKLKILQMAIETLTQHGYVYIGMDHFAKPNDELAVAQQTGNLHRNFQGYTTKPETDLIGFGISSISMVQDVYIQNHKKLKPFYAAIDQAQPPIERGVTLTVEDQIRRTVIMELMCQFQLSKHSLEEKYHLRFDGEFEDYFWQEQLELQTLEADGLIEISNHRIQVTPVGRLLIRNIAAVFDTYLRQRSSALFSKSV